MLNHLEASGEAGILIAVTDGRREAGAARNAAPFPVTMLQNHIVHLISNRLGYASSKERERRAASPRRI